VYEKAICEPLGIEMHSFFSPWIGIVFRKNQERMDEKNKSQWLNKTKKRRSCAAYFLSNLDRPIKIQYLATLSVIYPHSLWITF
jgi:hypothetical protein